MRSNDFKTSPFSKAKRQNRTTLKYQIVLVFFIVRPASSLCGLLEPPPQSCCGLSEAPQVSRCGLSEAPPLQAHRGAFAFPPCARGVPRAGSQMRLGVAARALGGTFAGPPWALSGASALLLQDFRSASAFPLRPLRVASACGLSKAHRHYLRRFSEAPRHSLR